LPASGEAHERRDYTLSTLAACTPKIELAATVSEAASAVTGDGSQLLTGRR
jgi:hypothetical protein